MQMNWEGRNLPHDECVCSFEQQVNKNTTHVLPTLPKAPNVNNNRLQW